jgi:hypothetical protein
MDRDYSISPDGHLSISINSDENIIHIGRHRNDSSVWLPLSIDENAPWNYLLYKPSYINDELDEILGIVPRRLNPACRFFRKRSNPISDYAGIRWFPYKNRPDPTWISSDSLLADSGPNYTGKNPIGFCQNQSPGTVRIDRIFLAEKTG